MRGGAAAGPEAGPRLWLPPPCSGPSGHCPRWAGPEDLPAPQEADPQEEVRTNKLNAFLFLCDILGGFVVTQNFDVPEFFDKFI